jgi:capsular polysaccharide biosynthesis protein
MPDGTSNAGRIAIADPPQTSARKPDSPLAQSQDPRLTLLAKFTATEPPLPRSIDGRRLDVFQTYRSNVLLFKAKLPVQVFMAEIPSLKIIYHPDKKSVAARRADGKIFEDLFRYAQDAVEYFNWDTPAVDLPGRSLIVAEGNAHSYYHFVLNALVRFAVVMQTHPRLPFDHVIVTDDSPSFVRDALDMLGIPRERIVSLSRTPRVHCERAWCGQYLSELLYPHPVAVQLIRWLFPSLICTGRRLYVVRETTRRVLNHDQVWDVLKNRGFEIVRPENLSLLEQVRLFASAEAVAAPHGAALTNTVFCPRGTKVIEFASPQFVETIYWFLAASCGHDYSILIGKGDDPPFDNKTDANGWRSHNAADIEIPIDRLILLCDAAGL